jgi:hypothetical protein
MIRRIRPSLNRYSFSLLAHSLVVSRLDYCNSILNNVNKSQTKKLQKVMNLTARIINNSNRDDRTRNLLKQLNWLPVEFRIKEKVARLVYLSLKSKTPFYLKDCLEVNNPNRCLRINTSPSVLLKLGSASKKIGCGSFVVAGPRIWNELDTSCRCSTISQPAFSHRLHNFYASRAFDE